MNAKLTLTVHISRDIQRGDMSLRDWLQPYSLPNTGTGCVEDMRGVVCLLPNYKLASPNLEKRRTSNIALGIGWIVDEHDKLILLSSLDVVGHIEPESKVPSSMEPSLLTLLIRPLSYI